MYEQLKTAMKIDKANCETCTHYDMEDLCDKAAEMENADLYPFKEELECWEPNFWLSRFANIIKSGTTEELNRAYRIFKETKEKNEN